jgi:hypothetical protein
VEALMTKCGEAFLEKDAAAKLYRAEDLQVRARMNSIGVIVDELARSGTFRSRDCFPLHASQNLSRLRISPPKRRPLELCQSGFAVVNPGFKTVVTTWFSPEDFEEFLFESPGGLKKLSKDLFQFIVVESD